MHTQTGPALAGGLLPFDAALMQRTPADDELTLTVASRLMQNYQAAAPVDGSRQIQASSDADGTPLLFSIGSDGRLYLMRPRDGAATGWELTDLSTGLPDGVEVRRFATARDPRGRPLLAAVCAPADRPDETLLFFTTDLSGAPDRWSGRGRKDIGRILDVAAGSNARGEILLVITAIQGDRITNYRILPDSTEHEWKAQTLPFPENGRTVLGIAVGHLASLEHISGRDVQGVLYTLYQDNAGTARLVLSSFPDTLYNHEVPVDADSAALALAPDGSGSTVLYTGGAAVWFYPVKAQMERDRGRALALREAVEPAGATTPVRALVADTDTGGAPEVWILRASGVLGFSRRNATAWSRPLPLEAGVGEMASWRAAPDRPVELYYVNAGGELHHLTQDPATTNWSDTQIVLPSTRTTVSLASYASKLVLTGPTGAPVAGRAARITASETTLVTVNGRGFIVGPAQAVDAAFDTTGAITVTNRVNRLSTPLLRVEADFLGHALEIDPSADVHARLSALVQEDPQKLVDATVTNARGEQVPLLKGEHRNVQNVRVAFDVLKELLPVARPAAADPALRPRVRLGHDDPRAAGVYARARGSDIGHRIDLSAIPTDWQWGVDFKGPTPRFIPGHQLPAGFAGVREGVAELGVLDDVWEFFGNLVRSVEQGLIQAGEFLLKRIGDVVEIWIDGLRVVLEYVEQVWNTVSYFFTEVLGTAIETLLEWIGFIFNWGDILATHRVLVAAFDTSMDAVAGKIRGAEPEVREFFRRLEAQLGGQELADRLGAAGDRLVERTATQTAATTPANRRDPASDWMYDQVSGGGLFHGAISSPFSPELEQRVAELAERIGGAAWDTLRTGMEAIQQTLTEDFGRLTAGELVQKVAGIIAATVLAEVETAVVSFLEVSVLLLDALRELLKTPWDVPLLSPLYREITGGRELSGLDLACLIFAVPVTIIYKIATGEAPFTQAEAERVAAAPTHPALVRELRGIAADRAAAAGAEVSHTGVALSLVFGGVGVGVGRLVGGVVNAVGVGVQEISGTKVFRGIKMTTDLVTYACAFTNLMLAATEAEQEAENDATTGRVWLERTIMLAQIAFPLADGIGWAVAVRNPRANKVVPWIKTAMGGVNAVAVTVLFILEAVEGEEVAEDDVLKFVENLVLATTQILAGPASLASEPRPRLVFAIAYALLGGLGAGLNIGRAVPVYKQGQLFRPI